MPDKPFSSKEIEDVELIDVNGDCSSSDEESPVQNSKEFQALGSLTLPPQYQIVGKLGEGGMGSVFLGRNQLIDRPVAIKVFTADSVRGETMMRRFQQEGRAASKLSHPNLAQLYEFGVSEEGLPYMIMEYVEGENLSEYIEKHGVLSVEQSIAVARQMCDGLEHAHERGVIHRDIKPTNIMIVRSGDTITAKLVDFGIAKVLETDEKGAQQLTREGDVFGSPLYMSPEQASGKVIDKRSDIYSLACVLYEALAGRAPMMGATVLETLGKKLTEEPESIRATAKRTDVPLGVDVAILRGLAQSASDRPQSMKEFWAEIERGFEGKSVRAKRKAKSSSRSMFVGGVLVVALAGFAAVFMLKPEVAPKAGTEQASNPMLATMKSANKDFVAHRDAWRFLSAKARQEITDKSYGKAKEFAQKSLNEARAFEPLGECELISLKLLFQAAQKSGELDLAKDAETSLKFVMHQWRCDGFADPEEAIEILQSSSSTPEAKAKTVNEQLELRRELYLTGYNASSIPAQFLDIARKTPKGSFENVRFLINSAAVAQASGNNPEAKKLLFEARASIESNQHPKLRSNWFVQAFESGVISQQALEKEISAVAPGSVDEFTLRRSLAEFLKHGNVEQALKQFQRVQEIAAALFGAQHLTVAQSLFDQGYCHIEMQSADAAAETDSKALDICKQIAPISRWTVLSLCGLGKSAWEMREPKRAVEYYLQAAAVAVHTLHPKTAELADVYLDTAESLWSYDKHDVRISEFSKKAEKIFRDLDTKDQRLAGALNLIGNMASMNNKFDEAERAYKEALAIRKQGLNAGDRRWDLAYENLSVLYRKFKHFEELRDITLEKIAIEEKALGPTHREIACDKYFLGDAYAGLKQTENAKAAYEQAMSITKIGDGLESYAKFLKSIGDTDKAKKLIEEAKTLKGPGL